MVGRAGCIAEGEHRVAEIDEGGSYFLVVVVVGVFTGLNGLGDVGEGLSDGGEEAEFEGALFWEGGEEVFDLGWAGAGCGHCGYLYL